MISEPVVDTLVVEHQSRSKIKKLNHLKFHTKERTEVLAESKTKAEPPKQLLLFRSYYSIICSDCGKNFNMVISLFLSLENIATHCTLLSFIQNCIATINLLRYTLNFVLKIFKGDATFYWENRSWKYCAPSQPPKVL